MDFMKWLQSLDELLYEIMSWLIFFPITLWRAVRHPLRMMHYSDEELQEGGEEQFTDTLSPPLFLILALILSHGLEIAMGDGVNPIVAKTDGLAALVRDDTSLLALRLIVFALFPLLFAARLVGMRGAGLTRARLKPPFYAQCYAAAPFALFVGVGAALAHAGFAGAAPIGAAIVLVAVTGYIGVQALWFSRMAQVTRWRGAANAIAAFLTATVGACFVALLFAL